MNAQHLVREIQSLMPNASPMEVLQMAYLVSVEENQHPSAGHPLAGTFQDVRQRLGAASDQFVAVGRELSSIARFDPCKFTPRQLWDLIRSLKVHSQLLRLYTGSSPAPAAAAG